MAEPPRTGVAPSWCDRVGHRRNGLGVSEGRQRWTVGSLRHDPNWIWDTDSGIKSEPSALDPMAWVCHWQGVHPIRLTKSELLDFDLTITVESGLFPPFGAMILAVRFELWGGDQLNL